MPLCHYHGAVQTKQAKESQEALERSLAKKDYENGLAERRRVEELVRAVERREEEEGLHGMCNYLASRESTRAAYKLHTCVCHNYCRVFDSVEEISLRSVVKNGISDM